MISPDNELIPIGIQEEQAVRKPGFGFWVTTGISMFIMVAYFIVSLAMAFGYDIYYLIVHDIPDNIEVIREIANSGFFLSLVTIVTSVVCTALVLMIIKVQKDITVRGYLGLGKFTKKAFFVSFGISIIFLIVEGVINWLIGGTQSTEWMDTIYSTIEYPVLLWIAVIIFAPAFEEIFFRGFIFEGYRNSKLRIPGTIFITSLGWALLHVQYDFFGMSLIFLYGILFGIIRWKTGSVWITFFLHAFFNLIAMLGTVLA